MTDWTGLVSRAGRAGHDLVGWLMWDPAAIAAYADLGVPNGLGWIQAWRLAPLGGISTGAAAATTYSIHPDVIGMILDTWRSLPDPDAVFDVRDAAIEPGLADIAPGLGEQIAPLADDLWRGVDASHHGARPLFAANCLRELRGDNHWALCAAADLDDVEVGLLHAAMVDPEEYGGEEWIARSRGADDEAIARGWRRLTAKGLASDGALNDRGREFRLDLEGRTDELTTPAWQAVGATTTTAFCDAVDAHHDAFVARIDETAGPRWMPAVRTRPR